MSQKYLIVSDLHLCNIEENSDGWKAYKSAKYQINSDFEELLNQHKNQPTTLIFNGDVIDFDLVSDVPKQKDVTFDIYSDEKKRGLQPTEEKSLWKLNIVLNDQKPFFEILSDFLSYKDNNIIYVIGNHDREFHFHSLQITLVEFLKNIANEKKQPFYPENLSFEPWFFYKEGEIYVEHGNQFDYYTSFRYILDPVIVSRDKKEIALSMGNLSNRYLLTSMGYFNPHSTDYILNAFSYFWHWLKFYAFSKRGLVFNWIFGSLKVLGKMVEYRKKLRKKPKNYDEKIEEYAKQKAIPKDKLLKIAQLHQLPIIYNRFRMWKEFWIDRLFLASLLVGGTIALALVPIPLWIKLMVPLSSFPLFFFIYERITQGETIFSIEEKIPSYAKKISEIIDTKIVVFGHTHKTRLFPLSNKTLFCDSGTWAPVYRHDSKEKLQDGLKNYIFVTIENNKTQIELGSCQKTKSEQELKSL